VVLDRLPDRTCIRHAGGLCSLNRCSRGSGRQIVHAAQVGDWAGCGLITGIRWWRRDRVWRTRLRTRRGNDRSGERPHAYSCEPGRHSFVDAHAQTPCVIALRRRGRSVGATTSILGLRRWRGKLKRFDFWPRPAKVLVNLYQRGANRYPVSRILMQRPARTTTAEPATPARSRPSERPVQETSSGGRTRQPADRPA
jgi:hypothetical protein